MPKRKSSLSRLTAQAMRSRLRRSGETPEKREARLQASRDRISRVRAEERTARLESARLSHFQARRARTPEQRNKRLERLHVHASQTWKSKTSQQREVRLERLRVFDSQARASGTGDQRETRMERLRVPISHARESESLEVPCSRVSSHINLFIHAPERTANTVYQEIEMEAAPAGVVVNNEPGDNPTCPEEYDIRSSSDEYLTFHTVKLEIGNDTRLRLLTVPSNYSKDSKIMGNMSTKLRSRRPYNSCCEAQTEPAVTGIKQESVYLGTSTEATVSDTCGRQRHLPPSDSVVTAVKNEFEVIWFETSFPVDESRNLTPKLDQYPTFRPTKSKNMKNTWLRVSLVRLEDSKDSEIMMHMKKLRSLRPPTSCFKAITEIKHEAVNLGTLTEKTVSATCESYSYVHPSVFSVTTVKNEFAVTISEDPLQSEEIEKGFYGCHICLERFGDNSALSKHILLHNGEKSEKSNICEKTVIFKSLLNSHMPSHTGEQNRPHACNIFGKNFLNGHMSTYTGVKPHVCTICQKKFSSKRNLNDHILIHTGEKPHACDICLKKFARKRDLRTHMTNHTGEKPHACYICQKKFSIKRTLNNHILTHTGEKPHACNICQRKFSTKRNLSGHMVIHTGEKPHACNICLKKFARKRDLRTHMAKHTGEKPHACYICQKKFSRKGYLNGHMLTHTGEKPHVCNICPKTFSLKVYLKKHLLTHVSLDNRIT